MDERTGLEDILATLRNATDQLSQAHLPASEIDSVRQVAAELVQLCDDAACRGGVAERLHDLVDTYGPELRQFACIGVAHWVEADLGHLDGPGIDGLCSQIDRLEALLVEARPLLSSEDRVAAAEPIVKLKPEILATADRITEHLMIETDPDGGGSGPNERESDNSSSIAEADCDTDAGGEEVHVDRVEPESQGNDWQEEEPNGNGESTRGEESSGELVTDVFPRSDDLVRAADRWRLMGEPALASLRVVLTEENLGTLPEAARFARRNWERFTEIVADWNPDVASILGEYKQDIAEIARKCIAIDTSVDIETANDAVTASTSADEARADDAAHVSVETARTVSDKQTEEVVLEPRVPDSAVTDLEHRSDADEDAEQLKLQATELVEDVGERPVDGGADGAAEGQDISPKDEVQAASAPSTVAPIELPVPRTRPETSSPPSVDDTFWTAIAQDELEWAWWLSRAMEGVEAQNGVPVLPSWTARALLLSWHARRASPFQQSSENARRQLIDVFSRPTMPSETGRSPEETANIVLASTASALLASVCGELGSFAIGWLQDATRIDGLWDRFPALVELLAEAPKILPRNIPASAWRTRSDVDRPAPSSIAGEARAWQEQIQSAHPNHEPALHTLRSMASDEGYEAGALLSILKANDTGAADEARRCLNKLADEKRLRNDVQSYYVKFMREKQKFYGVSLQGPAREWIINRVGRLIEIGTQWMQAVDEKDHQQMTWVDDQVAHLSRLFGEAAEQLDNWHAMESGENACDPTACLWGHMRKALGTVLCEMVGIDRSDGGCLALPRLPLRHAEDSVLWALPDIWLQVQQSGETQNVFEGAVDVARLLAERYWDRQNWDEVADECISAGHFALADHILSIADEYPAVLSGQERLVGLQRLYDEEIASKRIALLAEVDNTGTDLNEAFTQGAITEDYHTEALGNLSKLQFDVANEPFDLAASQRTVGEVRTEIREYKDERRRELNTLRGQLEIETQSVGDDARENALAWIGRADASLMAGDFELAEGFMQQAREAVEGKLTPVGHVGNNGLELWLERAEPIREWLENNTRYGRAGLKGKNIPLDFEQKGLSDRRRKEFLEVMDVFTRLRGLTSVSQKKRMDEAPQHVSTIFGGYLGFGPCTLTQEDAANNVFVYRMDIPRPIEDRERVPVPLFGSLAKGKYRIIVMWDRPDVEVVRQKVTEHGSATPTFVLYMGRISDINRRRWLTEVAKQPRSTEFVFIDEVLLVHLGDRRERLRALFDAALPYTTINPYRPTGLVPPEMYFGREEAIDQVAAERGACIVYGGRQLGKSAVLRHVASSRHEPQAERYALYEDIRGIGLDSGSEVIDEFWRRIRDAVKATGALPAKSSALNPDTIASGIERYLHEDDSRRLWLLIDEADRFLEEDAAKGFSAVDTLRRLMESTGHAFKVVFAGLHSVQRYHRIPNQPLAHLGPGMRIGPLAARDAHRLICEPLSALGFRVRPEAVTRIRGCTNSHPGLIQFFCMELIRNHWQKWRTSGQPITLPYTIDVAAVDEIYRRDETREEISNRLVWTISLDKRYEAILYSMITYILENETIFYSCDAREALELARLHWPQGFADMDLAESRSMLSELEGLGVLQRTTGDEARWQIASRQVVRLLGGVAAARDRLAEIGKSPAPAAPEPSHIHPALVDHRGAPSPLNQAQFTILSGRSDIRSMGPHGTSGVVVLHTSPASGSQRVCDAVKQFVWPDEGSRWRFEIVSGIPSENEWHARITATLDQMDTEFALLWVDESAPHSMGSICECIRSAENLLGQQHDTKRVLRIVFSLGPHGTWSYLKGLGDKESHVSVVRAARWRPEAVGIWLMRRNMPVLDQGFLERVCTTTGGWYWCIDQFHEAIRRRYGSNTDNQAPEPALSDLEEAFKSGSMDTEFAAALRTDGGWPSPADSLWQFMSSQEPLRVDDLRAAADIMEIQEAEAMAAFEWLKRLGYIEPTVVDKAEERADRIQWIREPVAARLIGLEE